MSNDTHTITGEFQAMTGKAICLHIDEKDHWFPLSKIEHDIVPMLTQRGQEVEIEAPEWLIISKDLEWMIDP